MNSVAYLPQSKHLLDQMREVLRYKHFSLKTEQVYLYWIRFFCAMARVHFFPGSSAMDYRASLAMTVTGRSPDANPGCMCPMDHPDCAALHPGYQSH